MLAAHSGPLVMVGLAMIRGGVGHSVGPHPACWHPPHSLHCPAVPQCTPLIGEPQPTASKGEHRGPRLPQLSAVSLRKCLHGWWSYFPSGLIYLEARAGSQLAHGTLQRGPLTGSLIPGWGWSTPAALKDWSLLSQGTPALTCM